MNPVERALASRVTLHLGDMILDDFAEFLSERFQFNVLIDSRALDDVGLGSESPLKGLQVEQVELETLIDLLLKQQELCFYVRDHILIITTPEDAENNLTTYIYPVGDLLGFGRNPDFDTLIEVITSSVAPDTWDEVGGAGSIESFPPSQSLVVGQTRHVHRQVQELLESLRKVKSLQPATRGNLRSSIPDDVGSMPYRPGGTRGGGFGIGRRPANRQGGVF